MAEDTWGIPSQKIKKKRKFPIDFNISKASLTWRKKEGESFLYAFNHIISSAYRFFFIIIIISLLLFRGSRSDPSAGSLVGGIEIRTLADYKTSCQNDMGFHAAMCLNLSHPIFHGQKDNLLTKLPLVSFQNCQRWRQVASKEKSTIFSFFFTPFHRRWLQIKSNRFNPARCVST
jgi:hypothetical protein